MRITLDILSSPAFELVELHVITNAFTDELSQMQLILGVKKLTKSMQIWISEITICFVYVKEVSIFGLLQKITQWDIFFYMGD